MKGGLADEQTYRKKYKMYIHSETNKHIDGWIGRPTDRQMDNGQWDRQMDNGQIDAWMDGQTGR